uniref:Reverse transcriptase domain-containing protein n=1 Tax=Kryptolebias marmoratus TaxID=37003 RepID=A0A3Q2ZQH6_KRYMA
MNILGALYEKNCVQNNYTKRDVDKPWMTKGLRNACKKKNNLYSCFLKLRTKESEDKYKKYKNKLVWIIRKHKKEYYSDLLDKSKSDMKATWQIMNSVLKNKAKSGISQYFVKDDNEIYDQHEIVNEFNNYFVNVGPSLAAKIPIVKTVSHTVMGCTESIFLDGTDKEEIMNIVKNFANKRSKDWVDMDMMFVKEIMGCVIEPFTYICNLSFSTGIFPDNMKTAKVIPLYKSGEKCMFTNYRPISLLPQFSKILEKLFVTRLDQFIDKQNILNNNQYGFRANKSTSMALMDLIEQITTAVDQKQCCVSIYVDLKKAFDTIDHNILLEKLNKYGIRGPVLQWVSSYLSNRKQFVQINDIRSELCGITCGVPQGSVLGPKLFILYVNDLVNVSGLLKCVLFADDTTFICLGEDIEQMLEMMQTEFVKIQTWFKVNKLSLNIDKTNYMIFSNKKRTVNGTFKVDGIEICRVSEVKFLGVIIDEKLTWRAHIDYLRTKISRSIAVLHKVKDIFNDKALFILYNAIIVPHLIYCIEVWGNACKTITNPIFILQKRAVRIITRKHYYHPSNILFQELGLLKFYELVDYYVLQIMYKAHKNILPMNIQLNFVKRISNYNLKGLEIFIKPKIRTNLKDKCTSVRGVRLWNGLDYDYKNAGSINSFKRMIKVHLLKNYEFV